MERRRQDPEAMRPRHGRWHRLRRCLARLLLAALVAASAWGLWQSARQIAADPLTRPVVERSAEGIAAATERAMAAWATPARVAARLETLLGEEPRNWLAIEAVEAVAAERGLALPVGYAERRQAAWAADDSWLAFATDCAACALDINSCALSAAMMCQVPIALSPLGDMEGIATEAGHYLAGEPVDRLNLGLSAVGLAATGGALVSLGSTVPVKVGAGVARLAHGMRLLTGPLTRRLERAIAEGVDWMRLPAARSAADLRGALRPEALRPVIEVAESTGTLWTRLGPQRALHLLRYVDDEADARRLARAAEGLGEKTEGRIEVLGKSRFLRATTRLSRLAQHLMVAWFGLLAGLGTAAAHLATTLGRRTFRGLLRQALA